MLKADEISKRLHEVCSDERLSYPTANAMVNAPLALIQTALDTERRVLQWVLGIKQEKK